MENRIIEKFELIQYIDWLMANLGTVYDRRGLKLDQSLWKFSG